MTKALFLDIGQNAQEASLQVLSLKAQGYTLVLIDENPQIDKGFYDALYNHHDYRRILEDFGDIGKKPVLFTENKDLIQLALDLGFDARLYSSKQSFDCLINKREFVVNYKTYRQVALLGHGKGGYSYLAQGPGGNVVVKQIHHESCDYYSFGNKMDSELNDYRRLYRIGINMPRLLDSDQAQELIVKQYISGPTVYDLVQEGPLDTWYIEAVKVMAERAQAGNLNLDWYPTNFIAQDNQLFYVDYECNTYDSKWSFKNWGMNYWVTESNVEFLFKDMENKDNVKAFESYEKLCYYAENGPQTFFLCPRLFEALTHKSAYVRIRAFGLLAINSQWDENQSYDMDKLFSGFKDKSPIAVRKALEMCRFLWRYKSQAFDFISGLDFSVYKDSMSPLLEKDRVLALEILK